MPATIFAMESSGWIRITVIFRGAANTARKMIRRMKTNGNCRVAILIFCYFDEKNLLPSYTTSLLTIIFFFLFLLLLYFVLVISTCRRNLTFLRRRIVRWRSSCVFHKFLSRNAKCFRANADDRQQLRTVVRHCRQLSARTVNAILTSIVIKNRKKKK